MSLYDSTIEVKAIGQYLIELCRDAGDPTDPIETMMIEQLAVAHHRLLRLHSQAVEAKAPEAAEIINRAAVRLMGEFRRMALGGPGPAPPGRPPPQALAALDGPPHGREQGAGVG